MNRRHKNQALNKYPADIHDSTFMKVICTFCNSVVRKTSENPDMISHGVCLSCYREIMRTYRFDVKKYLDMLDAPVFLVDDDVNILAANTQAISLAKKPLAEIKGQICGTVLECINAYLPEGCGKTPQCPDCTIREAVNETYRTETPVTPPPGFIYPECRREKRENRCAGFHEKRRECRSFKA